MQEYLVDLNGSKAAIRAGYSPQTAGEQAYDLLKKPQIADAVERLQEIRAARLALDADRVLEELKRVAFADIRSVINFGPSGVTIRDSRGLGADQAAAVAEVTESKTRGGVSKRVKMHDKVRALGLLLEHLPPSQRTVPANPDSEGEPDDLDGLTPADLAEAERLTPGGVANPGVPADRRAKPVDPPPKAG